jgi:stage IV sporulation protein B
MLKKFKFLLILILLIIPYYVNAYSDYIIASGENIGIKLKSKGIIVVGNYDNSNNFMHKGDIIVTVNNKEISDIKSFTDIISNNSSNTIDIGYIRDNKYKSAKISINDGKTGLYLKDTIVGIGTLTFIDPNNGQYGALGHEIVDSISGHIIEVSDGFIYDSKVIDIKRSNQGIPGEKNANISDKELGDIQSNNKKGIYGNYKTNIDNNNLYKVATTSDIKLGKAYILTELEDNKIDKYEINIISIDKKEDTKNIVFKVVDKRLLSIGGIVQGMSGSPIIQEEYIVGAVTHVVVDNPYKGYGILIEKMLDEIEKDE